MNLWLPWLSIIQKVVIQTWAAGKSGTRLQNSCRKWTTISKENVFINCCPAKTLANIRNSEKSSLRDIWAKSLSNQIFIRCFFCEGAQAGSWTVFSTFGSLNLPRKSEHDQSLTEFNQRDFAPKISSRIDSVTHNPTKIKQNFHR